MGTRKTRSLVEYLGEIADPRSGNGKRHDLVEVLVIAICAIFAEQSSFHCHERRNHIFVQDFAHDHHVGTDRDRPAEHCVPRCRRRPHLNAGQSLQAGREDPRLRIGPARGKQLVPRQHVVPLDRVLIRGVQCVDLSRAVKCCNHYPVADGRLIPNAAERYVFTSQTAAIS